MEINLNARLIRLKPVIVESWKERVSGGTRDNPLALPESLVHLVEPALDRIIERLSESRRAASPRVVRGRDTWPPVCQCGRNPYLEFYVQGEQAVMTHFSESAGVSCQQQGALRDHFRIVAMADIRGFGGMCRLREPQTAAETG